MSLLRLSDHEVQTRQTGEQMTHWDMLNKATKFKLSLFNMSQCVIAHLFAEFVPHDRSTTIGPLGFIDCSRLSVSKSGFLETTFSPAAWRWLEHGDLLTAANLASKVPLLVCWKKKGREERGRNKLSKIK